MASNDFNKLAEMLKQKYKKGSKEYHFRPYAIDGVFCYIILYFKFSLLTVESVNVKCKFTYNGEAFNQPYVLYHRKYKTFEEALQIVQRITTKYKILNGDLESPDNYEELKLENCVLPYSENEKCMVCYENTTDTTICNHAICFNCREKCILQQQLNCPMCRKEDIMHLYNNTLQLFNNRDSNDVNRVLVNNPYKYDYDANNAGRDDGDDGDDGDDDDGDDGDDGDDDDGDDDGDDTVVSVMEPREVVDQSIVLVNDIMNDFDQI